MPDRILTARVARIAAETADVMSIDLEAAHLLRLPTYAPGAHLDLHLPGGFMRSYSIAQAPVLADEAKEDDDSVTVAHYRLGIKREAAGRGGSASAHERLAVGDLVPISVPRCTFAMPTDPAPLLLLAGGIGLTPLLAMAQQRVHLGLPVELHVFARSRAAVPFAAALGDLERHASVMWHLDDVLSLRGIPVAERVRDVLRHACAAPGQRPRVAMCGPAGFMATVREACAQAVPPWPADRLQWEYFAAPDAKPEAPQPGSAAFVLRLVRQGVDVPVAADQSAVEALHDIGVDVPVSCQQGVCGTCVVGWGSNPTHDSSVKEGTEPEHHDHCLTEQERSHRVALCCMRARDAERPVLIDL